MSITEALFGEADLPGAVDEQEASDLGLHVRQCARRYRELNRKLSFVARLLLCLIGLHLVTVLPGGWKFLASLLAN